MSKIIAIIIFLFLLMSSNVMAQTWNLPDSRKNTRFTSDMYNIVRPMLSVRGFDNQNLPIHYDSSAFNHERVYGVKQILQRACGISSPTENSVQDTFQTIINTANETIDNMAIIPETVTGNAVKASAFATIALFTYIIEAHDGSEPGEPTLFSAPYCGFSNLPSHASIRAKLMDYLLKPTTFTYYVIPPHEVELTFK